MVHKWDKVVLSKTVHSNPKQANKWTGESRASLSELCLHSYPNLIYLTYWVDTTVRTFITYPLFCCFFLTLKKLHKGGGGGSCPIIELFIAFLTWTNLNCLSRPVFPKVRSADHFWSARFSFLVREKKRLSFYQKMCNLMHQNLYLWSAELF